MPAGYGGFMWKMWSLYGVCETPEASFLPGIQGSP